MPTLEELKKQNRKLIHKIVDNFKTEVLKGWVVYELDGNSASGSISVPKYDFSIHFGVLGEKPSVMDLVINKQHINEEHYNDLHDLYHTLFKQLHNNIKHKKYKEFNSFLNNAWDCITIRPSNEDPNNQESSNDSIQN